MIDRRPIVILGQSFEVYGIFDGISGGGPGHDGRRASADAAYYFAQFFQNNATRFNLNDTKIQEAMVSARREAIETLLNEAFAHVNQCLNAQGYICGTTAVIILANREKNGLSFGASVGDSRIYAMWADGAVLQLTEDDNFNNEVKRKFRETQGQEYTGVINNPALMRYLGGNTSDVNSCRPYKIAELNLGEIAKLILATDGVVNPAALQDDERLYLASEAVHESANFLTGYNSQLSKDSFDDAAALVVEGGTKPQVKRLDFQARVWQYGDLQKAVAAGIEHLKKIYSPAAPGRARLTIGRRLDNNIIIYDPEVSRLHAVIGYDGDKLWLIVHGQHRGVFLNRQKIDPGTMVIINPGDKLEIGQIREHTVVLNITSRLVDRDGVPYLLVNNPEVLTYGMNIPGHNGVDREVIAIRQDAATEAFLDEVVAQIVPNRSTIGSIRRFFEGLIGPNKLDVSVSPQKKIFDFVSAYFNEDWDDSVSGWQSFWRRAEENYKGEKYSLGNFLQARSGCGRHKAAALQLAYQELGFNSRFLRGQVDGRRMAWVEVEFDGEWYIADPERKLFLPSDKHKGKHYVEGENIVELPPTESAEEPGGKGTILP